MVDTAIPVDKGRTTVRLVERAWGGGDERMSDGAVEERRERGREGGDCGRQAEDVEEWAGNAGNRGTVKGFPPNGLVPKTQITNRGARAARNKQSMPLWGLVRHRLDSHDWLSQRSILNPQGMRS